MRCPILIRGLCVATGLLALVPSSPAQETFHYLARLGFTDAEHTSSDGVQHSTVTRAAHVGVFAGTSVRYAGGLSSSPLGNTAWLAGPDGSTRRVGFYDAAHTFADGRKDSGIVALNDCGMAAGYSARQEGLSAWIATLCGGTRAVGFYGAEYKFPNGHHHSEVLELNKQGKVIGYSERNDGGRTAWLILDPRKPVVLGLTDAQHVSPTGQRWSSPADLSDSGYVAGQTRQYVGAARGQTAWMRPPSGTARPVGLYGGIYTATNGSHHNHAQFVSKTGYVAGVADTFHGDVRAATVAWIARPSGQAVRVGLYDAVHVSLDGRSGLSVFGDSYSEAPEINDNGYAVGYSERRGTGSGQTAWVGSPDGQTRIVGLYDEEHSLSGGHVYSWGYWLTNSGYFLGQSNRWGQGNGSFLGSSAWFADVHGNTTRIGLFGRSNYGPSDSFSEFASGITESGYIWGFSTVYTYGGGTLLGVTPWIYHIPTRTLTHLAISPRPSVGIALGQVNHVLKNGVAFGTYRKFGDGDADLGDRAFVWVPGKGAFDIGERLDVPMSDEGWEMLDDAVATAWSGRLIAGTGILAEATNPGSQGVWLVSRGPMPAWLQ